MRIGAQLYTVRESCQTVDGIAESLKKVADIGYKSVQLSGICDCDPAWLKAELDKNGLTAELSHVSFARLTEETDKVIAAHKVLNAPYIGLGWYKIMEQGGIDSFYEKIITAAKSIRDSGFLLMYHNHDMEFEMVSGKPVLLHLAERFAPDEMGFTIDTYWAQAGGFDPARLIRALSGRCECIHLKDMSYQRMEAVGEGNLDWDAILSAAEESHVKYAYVEQDRCNGEDGFACLKRSYEYLRARGLE